MKDDDILLPEIFIHGTHIWQTISAWYHGQKGENEVTKVIKQFVEAQCREAVRMNQKQARMMTPAGELHGAEDTLKWIRDQMAIPPAVSLDQPRSFSLEAAKRGEPLVTRDGRKAKFIGYAHGVAYPVAVLIEGNSVFSAHNDSGKSSFTCNTNNRADLFLAPKPKRTVWVNVDWNGSKLAADVFEDELSASDSSTYGRRYATAVPIQIDDVGGEG